MGAVDVPVALLGYGTVGEAVHRLLSESGDEIERATGHRIRVVRAVVRDPGRSRTFPAGDGVLTTDFAEIRADPSMALVAEVMGGVEPTGGLVLDLLRAGKPVVSANKQLVARRGAELFAAARDAGVQLRFEASVCAAIPVIKVLRESLVVTNVHRVLGIVNGTTNFILTRMEAGADYGEALAEAQRLGYAEADPTEDVSGADAAAKMAILATVAFGARWTPAGARCRGRRPATCARRSTCTSRSRTGRACSRNSPSVWRCTASRSRDSPSASSQRALRSTSSRTRRRAGGSTTPLPRSRTWTRCAGRPTACA